MKRTCFLSMLLTAALTAACAGDADQNRAANQSTPTGGTATGTSGDATQGVSNGDRDFVREIIAANMAEIQMAKLALERASDTNVKKFAQMMVTDHTQAGEKLNAVASQHNLATDAPGDAEKKNPAEAFADKRGADFERQYADTMVDAHQDMVNKLESRIDKENLTKWKERHAHPATGEKAKGEAMTVVAEKSDNPVTLALNQWAAESYPVAFAHLQAAKDLQKGLEVAARNR